jgi:hypothetical protein
MKIIIAATSKKDGITRIWSASNSGKSPIETIKEMVQEEPDMELDHEDLCIEVA